MEDLTLKTFSSAYEARPKNGLPPLSYLPYVIHKIRTAFSSNTFDLQTVSGRNDYLSWWITHGINEYKCRHHFLSQELVDYLNAPLDPSLDPQITRYFDLALQWAGGKKVDFKNSPSALEHIAWFKNDYIPYFHLQPFFEPNSTSLKQELREVPEAHLTSLQFGVNIIGLGGTSGVGEDARMMIAALTRANIPHKFFPYLQEKETEFPYCINMFCLTAFQTLLAFASYGHKLMSGRHNIGFLPWELPEWPKDLQPVFKFCDQVWASSEFIRESVLGSGYDRVKKIPMAVQLQMPDDRWNREKLQLPANSALFLAIFDFKSGLERKNLTGTVQAFISAKKQRPSIDAKLVIKSMSADSKDPDYQKFLSLIQGHNDIIHFHQTIPREALTALYYNCDVYVSLHRAEGFGRCPAEAMLLEKQVIATDYSGTREFCLPETALLVPYELIPVNAQEYVFSENQKWANPSIPHAANAILEAFDRVSKGLHNSSGKALIQEKFSVASVAKVYSTELNKIRTK